MTAPRPTPGLLRGPSAWMRRQSSLSRFSVEKFADILLSNDLDSSFSGLRARKAIDALISAKIGGDCWSAGQPSTIASSSAFLFVAPELFGTSNGGTNTNTGTLEDLKAAIKAKNTSAQIILFCPPAATKASQRRMARFAADNGWRFVHGPTDIWALLENVTSVFTVGDEIGFLALLKGIEVHCFGQPFYAGWGLTTDHQAVARGGISRSIEDVFTAACLMATEYIDPHTGDICCFEDLCAILTTWRETNEINRRIAACLGMSFWKRRRMKDLLRSTDGAPKFCSNAETAVDLARRRGGAVAVWSSREPPQLAAVAATAAVPIIRIEDGFVRSVGLGADFTPAASIVLDETGIYFDPSKVSGLDSILESTSFSANLIDRSQRLIQTLITRGITKYNTGGSMPEIASPVGKRRLFVPGQVENDRSVSLGGAGIYRNSDLLRRVRALNPDAFILYKPHPDVDAGHRPGALTDIEILQFADQVVRDVSTAAIIPAVDEIHTLTSLAGFEALIRNKIVFAYGQPFYAGWGLTTDMAPIAHRRRRLSLEELVAGALILYPRYFDPVTRLPCGPEVVIDRVSRKDIWAAGPLVRLRRLQGDIVRYIRTFRSSIASASR